MIYINKGYYDDQHLQGHPLDFGCLMQVIILVTQFFYKLFWTGPRAGPIPYAQHNKGHRPPRNELVAMPSLTNSRFSS
jgi:hypothetical protein